MSSENPPGHDEVSDHSKSRGRLMYRPHPEENRLRVLMPTSLVEAVRHPQQVTFAEVAEMRAAVRELADLTVSECPHFVLFFATGSIPYVIPLLHVLSDRGERRLTDGTRFHLFPGLSWGGRIDGRSSIEFFAAEFVPLLGGALDGEGGVRILSIDTTNTGNAVNRIVAAFEAACEGVPAATPERVELTVVGVVNGRRAGEPGGSKTEVVEASAPAFVLTPKGYTPDDTLRNRVATRFRRDRKGERFTLRIAYWIASNIPSEDEVELIGAKGLHRTLAVEPDGTAGRIVVAFDNGMTTESTGLGSLGRRFLSLLSAKEPSFVWTKLCDANALAPPTEEERADYEEGKFWTRGGLRQFELDRSDPDDAVRSLLGQDDLESVEIDWLARRVPVPKEAITLVRASALKDPITRGPEAIRFFRSALPELAAGEPPGGETLDWWLDRLPAGPAADGESGA